MAFDRVEPIGGGWIQSAITNQNISALRSTMGATVGVEIPVQELETFMPGHWVGLGEGRKKKKRRKGIGLKKMRERYEARG